MKIKSLCILLAAASLLVSPGARAQAVPETTAPTNGVAAELHTLVQQVQAKLKTGKTTEADFSDELKAFDSLLAKHAGEKTDAVAQVLFMKAMLYLEVFDDTDKGTALIKQLKQDYPDTKAGKSADKILEQLAKQAEAKKVQAALMPGATFPDFAEKDLSGGAISVGALKGKVVLVDFWATWCPPCRAELPNVIATYKKYHSQGFDIIGVSLDSDRAKLEAFIKQHDGMVWPQYFDGMGWQNKLAEKYGVESIPFTILVGADGKIIGTDLRGEALGEAVGKALKK